MDSEVHDAAHNNITNKTVPTGTEVHDKAIVTGSPDPTGTVDFLFFSTDDCTGVSVDENNVDLVSGTAESTPVTPLDGQFSYKVHYDGDGNHAPADGPCEPFTVGPIGGIAELPALAYSPMGDLPAGPSGDKSSAASQAALGAALVLGAIILAAGAWYAGRRWFV